MRDALAPLREREFRLLFAGEARVYSYDALGSFVLIPVGLAVVGPVADVLGTRETLLLAATLNLLATLAVLASREVRTLQRRTVLPDSVAA